jgi:putative copper resistance protein D
MSWWALVSIWLHMVAAGVWVGSMIFFAVAVVPLFRDPDLRAVRARLLGRLGVGFRRVGWAALALLIITGATNLLVRDVTLGQLLSREFWSSRWGTVLGSKLVLVLVALVLSAIHDLYLGPRALRLAAENPDGAETHRLRRAAAHLGRLTLLVSLAITVLGVVLARSG